MSLRCLLPVRLGRDEERGLARVAVRRLEHQVGAQPGRLGRAATSSSQSLDRASGRSARWRADLVAEPGGDELGVQVLAQLGRRQDQVVAELRRRSARSPRRRRPWRSSGGRPGPRRCMKARTSAFCSSQLLISSPLSNSMYGLCCGREHPRVRAVPGVVVGDVGEVADPPVEPEQVERGRADEVDRDVVGAEEVPDLGDVAQRPLRRRAGLGRSVGRVSGDVRVRRRGYSYLDRLGARRRLRRGRFHAVAQALREGSGTSPPTRL